MECRVALTLMVTAPATIWDRANFGLPIEGEWYPIPPEALIKTANPVGEAIVWYRPEEYPSVSDPKYRILCFIPSDGVWFPYADLPLLMGAEAEAAAPQLGCWSSPRLILEIDIRLLDHLGQPERQVRAIFEGKEPLVISTKPQMLRP
jgi:hypothetical protein